MKKVLVLFGSPRKNSNTHILVEEACKGLRESGTESEIIFLNDINFKGCQACYYCKKKGVAECAVIDGLTEIYNKINKADGVIIASPIYFGGVTGQTKLCIDRLFPYIDMKLGSLLPKGKKAAFIFTQNQADPKLFTEHIAGMKQMLGFIGFEMKESLLTCNLDKGYKPSVTENREAMRQAFMLGKNLLS